MNAPDNLAARAATSFASSDGTTTMDVRYPPDPEAAMRYGTEALRRHFLVDSMFRAGAITLTYSHVDRVVVGGAAPGKHALSLPALKPLGTETFLARREVGVFNVGRPGSVAVDGERFDLRRTDSLYVGRGARDVTFESADPDDPARFYLVSAPAHAAHPTRKLAAAQATRTQLGTPATANVRTIHRVIDPQVCASCQLVMGFTVLEAGSVWNTMPAHLHGRRCEVYFYFDLAPDARVFHLLGEPRETRHIVVANEQAIISPSWSLHSGVGTARYAFVWAMAGDNQDYTDMDALALSDLR